jgi:hypothetical protein
VCVCVCVCVLLGIEPRAFGILDKLSTTWAITLILSYVLFCSFFKQILNITIAKAGLELWILLPLTPE